MGEWGLVAIIELQIRKKLFYLRYIPKSSLAEDKHQMKKGCLINFWHLIWNRYTKWQWSTSFLPLSQLPFSSKGCKNFLVEKGSDLKRYPLADLTSPWDSNILPILEDFSELQKCQQPLSTANERNLLACNTIVANSVTHWKERRLSLPES